MMTGRTAWVSISAAARTSSPPAAALEAGPAVASASARNGRGATRSSRTSSGTMTTTGPGRPETAAATASLTAPGMSSARFTTTCHLVTAANSATWSISVSAPVPRLLR